MVMNLIADFSGSAYKILNIDVGISDCTYHLLEDSGHNPMIEIPMTFDKLLIEWIKTH